VTAWWAARARLAYALHVQRLRARPLVLVGLACALITAAGEVRADAASDHERHHQKAAGSKAAPSAPRPAPPPVDSTRVAPELGRGWVDAEPSALRYELDGVDVRGNSRTSDGVVLRYVPFDAGDVIDVADPELELLRYRLLGTGFFSDVRISLRRGRARGRAVLVVEVVERNTLIVEKVAMGIAADEDEEGNAEPISPFLGVQAAETNLAGTGVTLGAGFAVAAEQFALESHFAYPYIADSPWMVTAGVHYIDAQDFFGSKEVSFESPLLVQRNVTDYAVVSYERFGGSIGAGVDVSLPLRVLFDYQLERVDALVPNVASHVRGETREPIDFDILPGASVLSMIHTSLVYDSRDAPFLPERGTFASVKGTFGLEPLGSSYGFAKLEGRYQRWWKLPWRHVVSLEGEFGAIAGDAPFFEQFYVGDYTDLLPDRVLGLNPDRRQPPNFFGTNVIEVRYGDYAARLEGEYSIPLYRGGGAIYGIDFFGGAGLYAVATREDFTDPASGYEGASRVPLDLTYNAGLRFETYVGGFSFAVANLVGLLPPKRGDRK
jgi:outer membrane protein insertion porin family